MDKQINLFLNKSQTNNLCKVKKAAKIKTTIKFYYKTIAQPKLTVKLLRNTLGSSKLIFLTYFLRNITDIVGGRCKKAAKYNIE